MHHHHHHHQRPRGSGADSGVDYKKKKRRKKREKKSEKQKERKKKKRALKEASSCCDIYSRIPLPSSSFVLLLSLSGLMHTTNNKGSIKSFPIFSAARSLVFSHAVFRSLSPTPFFHVHSLSHLSTCATICVLHHTPHTRTSHLPQPTSTPLD